jgi:hypothetical protein
VPQQHLDEMPFRRAEADFVPEALVFGRHAPVAKINSAGLKLDDAPSATDRNGRAARGTSQITANTARSLRRTRPPT